MTYQHRFSSLLIAVILTFSGCTTQNRSNNATTPVTVPELDETATLQIPGSVDKDDASRQSTAVVAPASEPEPHPVTGAAKAREGEALRQRLLPKKKASAGVASRFSGRAVHDAAMQDLRAIRLPSESLDRENYAHIDENPVKSVSEAPVSTFSIDVDSGSYSNVRRILNAGRLPRKDAVRVEEFINYFSYDYPAPSDRSQPFNVITEIGPNPWKANSYLLHVGIKGYEIAKENVPAANLVFLIDVSGSMRDANKLGLLKSSLKLLTRQLRSQDRVSIVVYAGASGVVLEPVAGNETAKIMAALDNLTAGGSTNGAAGIRLAYNLAEQAFVVGGINRILLATDGDFNVGTINFEALKNVVEEKRKRGVSLTTLGFGAGNYNDHLMEQLADVGNGNHAYIDNLNEARKVLVEQMSSTLQTIAKDVKIQIEFNPAFVEEYRLVGYENRMLKREDFNNDKVDAGEIGAGHTVTALYEIVLVGDEGGRRIDPLRYQEPSSVVTKALNNELAYLRLRYKAPSGGVSQLIETAILANSINTDFASLSEGYRFSAAVAAFAQRLRGGTYMDSFDYGDILSLAREAKEKDLYGYRGEFLSLVNLAEALATPHARLGE